MKKIETTSLWLMINEIIIAIQRGWDLNFDDVEMVQYTEVGEDGTTATRDGRFDHIEIDDEVAKVWCIAGTGYENFSFPIGQLSEESVKDLHNCLPAATEEWERMEIQANEDLLKAGVMLVTSCEEDGFFNLDIIFGMEKENPSVLCYKEREQYAENYFENEMENLIADARNYAWRKVSTPKPANLHEEANIIHWVRLAAESLGNGKTHFICNDKNLPKPMPVEKQTYLMLQLITHDPRPFVEYLESGCTRLRRAEIVGNGTKTSPYKAQWRDDFYKD